MQVQRDSVVFPNPVEPERNRMTTTEDTPEAAQMRRGTLSSKGQITIPASILRALRLRPGDKLEFEVEGRTLKLRPSRPDMLATLLAHQFSDPTMTDAAASVRRDRGWDEEDMADGE